jgi:hypothetical protein
MPEQRSEAGAVSSSVLVYKRSHLMLALIYLKLSTTTSSSGGGVFLLLLLLLLLLLPSN